MQGEDVRDEDIIADNMATIAQELTSKGNLAHPSTIYKLCKDDGVPLREFTRIPSILELSYITAKRMETIRYESQYHEEFQGIEETLSSMQFFQQTFYENMQKSQADYMEEVKQLKENKSRFTTTTKGSIRKFVKSKRSLLRRSKRKQVNLWTNNVSSKEAYACWAQQQANPNLSEIPITQISDIMRTNLENGRPLFHGFLKSDYEASSSSQVDPEEPVLLRIAPPSPHFRPPHPPPN
ncbi:hypothetical protein PIB30_079143 [Stylosanthes scabra]|uniref:Uncharacterized protein n=1 Tax=Stylosanthes scabra TaxID=79078 RepID=A0ABU6SRG3_9FABA|nr:hypothetical protein [Stylosanthes scabra]